MIDRRIRLLLASDAYPPMIGGADLQVQMIAHAMSDAGHAVTVATPWQPGLAEREDEGGVIIHRTRALTTRVPWFSKDPGRRHHPPFPDLATTLTFRRLVREFQPDLVHSYGWITYSAAASLIGTDIPLVVSARDYGYICPIRSYLYYQGAVCSGPALLKCARCAASSYTEDEAGNAVHGRGDAPVTNMHRLRGSGKAMAAVAGVFTGKRLLRRNLRGVHSVSSFVRGVMSRHLLAGVRSIDDAVANRVIPSFLPPVERGVPDVALLGRLPREPYILFVGGLLPGKGIWPLLGAYARLRDGAPPLVLLGPSYYKSPTEFPRGVLPLGPTSHSTVMEAWEGAMFGVIPSVLAETFGNVATEAMSRGRPVIGSKLGGIVDIIVDGESGLLVPPADEGALAAAMQRLIDDPALRAALGEAARKRVERFAALRVIPQFEALYEDVLSPR